jgi:hypothetical protein
MAIWHSRFFGVLALVLAGIPSGWAAPIIDGTRDGIYGNARTLQTVDTGFGDNSNELDAAYAIIQSGTLYLLVTGNLEANFNRLEIFIDSKAGGQSVFDSSGNDNTGRMDGMIFDAGFTADYHLDIRRGDNGGNLTFDLDFANLGAQSASGYVDIMNNSGIDGAGSTGTGVNANPIFVGYNNSNTAGVGGLNGAAADQDAAAAVTTGLEVAISLSDLDYQGGDLSIMVGLNGSGHDYWSNQFLGGMPIGQGNVGGDGNGNFTGEGAIDLQSFAGDQFFTAAIPEPSTYVLLGVAMVLGAVARRRYNGLVD